jgi:signal transduction histidine kinase
VRWDGLEWRLYSARDGLPADEVRAICEDVQGDLWIGTSGGLARFRNGQFAAFRKQDGLASDDISSLLPDADGALWIGTRGSGLMRFKESAWTSYTTTHGLAGNSIGYLIKDGEGNLWLGSNAGLMRAPKTSLDEFARGERESIICRAYVEADGLPTRECTQGSQPAATRSADGTLWLPTAKGLVSIHPSKLKPNPFPPPVIIESVLIEGAEQGTGRIWPGLPDQIVVSPREEQLEIRYTSLNLGAAGRSQFKYRLAGHETAWNEVANTRVARYSKLPPGDYRFEVMAANEDGVWNTTPAAQVIIIQPPFWKTAWFMAVSILCLLGAVVLVVYYFSTQKLQRQLAILRQQEALERERARIARDLHDQLGANLTQVALLGELAQEDKHLPAEVDSHAQQITQTARETTKALDEIVWAVNPSNDTLEGLINYICKYAQEYFQIAGLKYRLDVPTQLPQASIPPDVRHNVFLAAKEAVNNVVKHAQATEAWLRLQLEPHRFTLEIQDNGRGLGPITDSPNGRNGLRNMRKRMEDIGGSFSIGAAAERGAVVRLSAPLKTI